MQEIKTLSSQTAMPFARDNLVGNVVELVGARFGEALTLADLAAAACMPTNTLTRQFNRIYGMSPMRWLWCFRTILAAELIAAAPEWSLSDVAMHVGFASSAHFSRRFRELFRESPSRFRDNFRRVGARQGATRLPLATAALGHGAPAEFIERALAKLARCATTK